MCLFIRYLGYFAEDKTKPNFGAGIFLEDFHKKMNHVNAVNDINLTDEALIQGLNANFADVAPVNRNADILGLASEASSYIRHSDNWHGYGNLHRRHFEGITCDTLLYLQNTTLEYNDGVLSRMTVLLALYLENYTSSPAFTFL